MSNRNQSSTQSQKRPWAALWPVLLLAPLSMAPKGCNSVVIGDDCPDPSNCTMGSAGTAGSDPVASAGAAGKPIGSGGSAGSKPIGSGGSAGSKPIGSGGSPGVGLCGGLQGLQCAATEYCAFDATAACGAADQTGVCKPRPQVCTDIYAPVCACDGQTYSSDCNAEASGSSVLHTGVCDLPSSGNTCGGLKPATCAKSEYCNFPIATNCGSGDQTGTCARIPSACDAVYAPVCGCDNMTYSSACDAAMAGIAVAANGACSTPSTTCGGKLGGTCASNEYCTYPLSANCGRADATGTCSPILQGGCLANYDPVCGCDGKTYGNTCEAGRAGVAIDATGACP